MVRQPQEAARGAVAADRRRRRAERPGHRHAIARLRAMGGGLSCADLDQRRVLCVCRRHLHRQRAAQRRRAHHPPAEPGARAFRAHRRAKLVRLDLDAGWARGGARPAAAVSGVYRAPTVTAATLAVATPAVAAHRPIAVCERALLRRCLQGRGGRAVRARAHLELRVVDPPRPTARARVQSLRHRALRMGEQAGQRALCGP